MNLGGKQEKTTRLAKVIALSMKTDFAPSLGFLWRSKPRSDRGAHHFRLILDSLASFLISAANSCISTTISEDGVNFLHSFRKRLLILIKLCF